MEPPRILVAEANEAIQEAIATAFRRSSTLVEIDAVASGDAAIESLRNRTYALIVGGDATGMTSGIDVLVAAWAQQPLARRILVTRRANLDLAIAALDRAHVHGFVDMMDYATGFETRLGEVAQRAMSDMTTPDRSRLVNAIAVASSHP